MSTVKLSKTRPLVDVRPLPLVSTTIKQAAIILSNAFSTDSLVRYLYKDLGQPWNPQNPALQRWQERRVWDAALTGTVLEARTSDDSAEMLGLCMLHPPRPTKQWTSARWLWLYFRHVVLTKLWAAKEPFCDGERVAQLFGSHDEYFAKSTAHYPKDSVWYLSVVAVAPLAQGLGVGGRLMRAALSTVGNSPCFLECTETKNVDLYQRFGFELVEKALLEDKHHFGHHTSLYYMIREGKLDGRRD